MLSLTSGRIRFSFCPYNRSGKSKRKPANSPEPAGEAAAGLGALISGLVAVYSFLRRGSALFITIGSRSPRSSVLWRTAELLQGPGELQGIIATRGQGYKQFPNADSRRPRFHVEF
jgi:hypothetical protein